MARVLLFVPIDRLDVTPIYFLPIDGAMPGSAVKHFLYTFLAEHVAARQNAILLFHAADTAVDLVLHCVIHKFIQALIFVQMQEIVLFLFLLPHHIQASFSLIQN
jgi:hypothetical protein